MPSPGVMMPTMRSPGTAPPLGAKRTGRSVLMPRIGIAAPLSASPGSLNFTALAALQAEPAALRLRRNRRDALVLVIGIHGAHDIGRPSSRRGRPPTSRRRSRRAPAAAARLRAFRRNIRSWRAGTAARRCAGRARILVAHRVARGAADGVARLAGDDDRFPGGGRRGLRLRGQDLHLVAVLQRRAERADLAVDLGADRHIADVGMHRIGEIDRRRAARQRDQLAFRREAEHLVVEQFELGVLQKFFRIGAFGQKLDGAAQPAHRRSIRATAFRSASRRSSL